MPTAMLAPDFGPASTTPDYGDKLSLADALDRILHRGVSLQGNLTIGLADVDLLYLDLRLLLGSVDSIWPEGRSPVEPVRPRSVPPAPPDPSPKSATGPSGLVPAGNGPPSADPRPSTTSEIAPGHSRKAGSSPAEGLVRLVLTLVKLLHDVLERQAVRRMEAGRLNDAQIENLGTALFAQAEEIERLKRQFGFSDKDLSLNLGAPDRPL